MHQAFIVEREPGAPDHEPDFNRNGQGGPENLRYLVVTDEPWNPATLPPRPWLAPPYLMRGEITLPHGPGGGGKSQLAIAWACALALGEPFGRLKPRQRCRVLLTNFEDGKEEQERRLTAALEYFGATPEDLAGWLYRASVGASGDATMFLLDDYGVPYETEGFKSLEATCQAVMPDLVVLDPLVAINAVPEINNQLMRRVMVILRTKIAMACNAALILVHHDNKGMDDGDDQKNVRGAGDIVNAVRFELAVKTMSASQAERFNIDPDRRGYYFRLGSIASKLNYAAPEDSEWFERLAVVVNGEAVVRCIPWQPPSSKLDDCQVQRVIAAVEKGTKEGPYSPKLGVGSRSLTPLLVELGVTALASQRRVLDELLKAGRIEKAEFRRPGHGSLTRTGLRTPNRLPYQWDWTDVEDGNG